MNTRFFLALATIVALSIPAEISLAKNQDRTKRAIRKVQVRHKQNGPIGPLDVLPITNPKVVFVPTPFPEWGPNIAGACRAEVTFALQLGEVNTPESIPEYIRVRATFEKNGDPGFDPHEMDFDRVVATKKKPNVMLRVSVPHMSPDSGTVRALLTVERARGVVQVISKTIR